MLVSQFLVAFFVANITIGPPPPRDPACGVRAFPAPAVDGGRIVIVPRDMMRAGPDDKRVVIPPAILQR